MAEDTNRYSRIIGFLGGRKFIAFMTVMLSASTLAYTKHIADGVYSAVVIAAIAAYIAGNVAQKKVQKDSETEN